jgi:hypothetical protein
MLLRLLNRTTIGGIADQIPGRDDVITECRFSLRSGRSVGYEHLTRPRSMPQGRRLREKAGSDAHAAVGIWWFL